MLKNFRRKPTKHMKEELKDPEAPLQPEQEAPQSEAETPEETSDPATAEQPADATTEATDALEAIARLQVELRDTRRALEEQQQLYLRLQADFQNFRKRKEREMGDTVRFANQELIRDLLPVLDNFDRTLDAIAKTDNLAAIKDGVAMVAQSMKRQLEKIGVEPIATKGQPFDSTLHEAITTVSVPDDAQKGLVIDEVEKGYRLKDRVIRFSKVIVGE